MPVDSNIALGFRQPEIESPLNGYAKMMAIQHAQNQNALSQYQLSSAQRNDEVQNGFLRDVRAAGMDPAAQEQAYLRAGKAGDYAKILKERADAGKVTADTGKIAQETLGLIYGNFVKGNSPLAAAAAGPEGVAQHVSAMYADPVLGPLMAKRKPLEQALAENIDLYSKNPDMWAASHANLTPEQMIKVLTGTPNTENLGDKSRTTVRDAFGNVKGTPTDAPIGLSENTRVTAETSERNNKRTVAEAARGHTLADARARDANRIATENRAPSITTIVDPTNPDQMISIDARRYNGGGNGAPGVIGVSGREPGAALRLNKLEKGRSDVLDTIDVLRAEYDALHANRDIPSTQNNVVENLAASVTRLPGGQAIARAGGSEAQSHRDVIESSRLQLLNAIKQATGMSAQQLNSNVELRTWLDAVSNPYQAKEAVDKILDNIAEKYGRGGSAGREAKGKIAPAGAAPAKPAVAPPPGFKLD